MTCLIVEYLLSDIIRGLILRSALILGVELVIEEVDVLRSLRLSGAGDEEYRVF